MSTNESIDLAKPRVIAIRHGQQIFEYTVPLISHDLWLKYFDGIVSTAEREGKEVVQHIDASSAGLELVEKLLPANPETRVPMAHKLAIVNVLTSAYVPDGDMRGFGEIPLVAIWSASENKTMRRHKDLVHVFEEPTAEQNRRYRRDDSRSQIVGGSRKGMTVYRGAQRTLAALYDELIVSVEGYTVNGEPLTGRENVARSMDTYHKVASVMRVFAAGEVPMDDEEEE